MPNRTPSWLIGIVWLVGIVIMSIMPVKIQAVEISDGPMEVLVHTAPPILMFLLDNSGSMDSEMMTPEAYGLSRGAYYIFADHAYKPEPDHIYGKGYALNETGRRAWKTQWSGYNRVFYSPRMSYTPWPSTTRYRFRPAGLDRPLSNPMAKNGSNVRVDLAATFFSVIVDESEIVVANAHYFVRTGSGNNRKTYLVTWEDADQDGVLDLGGSISNDKRKYYRFIDNGNDLVDGNELVAVLDESEKKLLRPVITNATGGFERYATDREELQNFANWFTYHRRRELAAKAAVAALISGFEKKYVGLMAINGPPKVAVLPVRLISGEQNSSKSEEEAGERLLNALYNMDSGGRTPLRHALDQAGRYLHQDLSSEIGPSPFLKASQGGGCQRSSVVIVTDGFGNGPAPSVGNADGDDGRPYADGWDDTLADVAIHFYESDLAPGLPDDVPAEDCDDVSHQHMTTFTLSFGMPGDVMQPIEAGPYKVDTCRLVDNDIALTWPQPHGDAIPEMPGRLQAGLPYPQHPTTASVSDVLWHTAINGRGNYLDIVSDQTMNLTFPDLLITTDGFASSSGVAVNDDMGADQAIIYQAKYHAGDWSGEVEAITRGGSGPVMWRASEGLRTGGRKWDTRQIVTYGGGWQKPQGVAFRYGELSAAQMASLGSDLNPRSSADRMARDLVDYIRGRDIDGYRLRASLLGDIVHSIPVVFGNTLFVGSNDGMLHALNTRDGSERFAYVPNLVLPNLKALASPSYPDHHLFYVDGSAHAGEVLVGEYKRKTFLVGGLGKGGKGYYCMLVGHRERSRTGGEFGDYEWIFHVDQIEPGGSERSVGQYIQWEYPQPRYDDDEMDNDQDGETDELDETDPDLGYSFSRAYCVNGNSPDGTYRPVVIFGNGYNSASRSAVLYVLSAESGTLIRKIDTGQAGDNGLSTPALIDVNLDRRVDYAFAGDLQGNLWKFDLTADSPERWGVAYGDDKDGDGVIDASQGDAPSPLFQSNGQPITGRPDVMIMRSICAAQAPGYLVVFGTGRYLGLPDRSDQGQQSIFGIWDFGDDSDDSEHLGTMVGRQGLLSSGLYLVRQEIKKKSSYKKNLQGDLDIGRIDYNTVKDVVDGDDLSVNNNDDSMKENPDKYVGWFYDFPVSTDAAAYAAERVTSDTAIRGGKTIITSHVPDNTPCGSGGHSRLYVLTGCDGAITQDSSGDPLLPIRFEGKIGDRPVVLKVSTHPRIDRILTGNQRGEILSAEFLGEYWGKVSWYQNIND